MASDVDLLVAAVDRLTHAVEKLSEGVNGDFGLKTRLKWMEDALTKSAAEVSER